VKHVPQHLFAINDYSPTLPKVELEIFTVVAKLMYASLFECPNILLAVSLLCTQVSKATKQDQQMLKQLFEYLCGTLDATLTLGTDEINSIRIWVDASYAVHKDMKSQTGGIMLMGTGGLPCKSTKQKLNTKSSTKVELVGATEYIPNTIWSKLYLKAQGRPIATNTFSQNHISAIKLHKNGKESA
jgi:hypothetical protein